MSAPRTLWLAALLPALPAQAQPATPPAATEAAPDEAAQPHLLEIRDGRLHLDGRTLPPDATPPGLDLGGLTMEYRFSGPVTPVLEIDGEVYVLQGERLVRHAASSRAAEPVYFLDSAASPEREAAAAPMPEPQLRRASEAAYLQQLSAGDRALFEQIRREEALERESLELAEEIRRTNDPAARARLTERLRADLDEAFELKQAIRTAEVERAETQIEELRRMLHDRGARKQQVIEHRMRELVGE